MEFSQQKYTAVIPAGGTFLNSDRLPANGIVEPISLKAMADIHGSTLLSIVLTALGKVDQVERCIVVGPVELADEARKFNAAWTDHTGNLLGNVQLALNEAGLSGDDPVLVIAADLAQPNPNSISAFLDSAPNDAKLTLPLISKVEFVRAYPGSPSTFVGLKEGYFTVGSQITAPAGLILDPPPAVSALLGNRKSQIDMARVLGIGMIWGLLTRSLTIHALETRVSQLVGVKSCAVANCAPDLALDIDDAADLEYARSVVIH